LSGIRWIYLSKPNAARAAGKFPVHESKRPCKSHNAIAIFVQIAVHTVFFFIWDTILIAKFAFRPWHIFSSKTFRIRSAIKQNQTKNPRRL
jgi:hypothetical protein